METRRRALAEFLRSRRDRLSPETAGIASAGRRRAPGLRREEVAALAGVGLTWYTWLEQGRPINASAQVLCAVARALRLEPHERDHMLRLAGANPGKVRDDSAEVVTKAQRLLLEQMLPYPACVVDGKLDLLAYNRTYRHLYGDLETTPERDRNCLWLIVCDPGWRRSFVEHPEAARNYVSRFRAAYADHMDDPSWTGLVDRLRAQSPLFAELWQRHDVQIPEDRSWRLHCPHVGVVELDSMNFARALAPKSRMVVLTPADAAAHAALARLDAMFAERPPTTVRPDVLAER
ncbi:MAG: helix-turn-helix transcriptional regulator [Segniliparus sp.]|uniref:helix-turn-helix transcriptional regulator n=1 Tax=Segniliparus sp. TaxID=2804064 RepID=UPI003F3A7E4D